MVLHKSFVFPHGGSVASRIKPELLFPGVTPPSHTSTKQFHYDHGLIGPSVPDQRSPGKREVWESKSNRSSLHLFPCLPFTSKVLHCAALSCHSTDNNCKASSLLFSSLLFSSLLFSSLLFSSLQKKKNKMMARLNSLVLGSINKSQLKVSSLLF